jgi:hypothetical protein
MRSASLRGLGLAAGLGGWLLLSGAAGAFQLRDDDGKFSARFPAQPTLDKRAGMSPTGPQVHHTWEVEIEGRHYSVTYTEYATPPVKNYNNNVKKLLEASKGRLIRQTRIEQGGIDGLEIVTVLPNSAVMRQRMFQVGNRLYQALYGGPSGSEKGAEVEAFMESFTLLK